MIKKAIIPAAGYGTGFLPATKASSKELLPIVDKPVIQFIVEEAIESGIEEILIITGKQKRSIEDHFDSNYELEENLKSKGKEELLSIVRSTTKENLFFVRQSYPVGLGDAILQAKAFVDNEPFAVLLGDNIFEAEVPVTKQLIDFYEEHRAACVAAVEVEPKDIERYGMVEIERENSIKNQDAVYHVREFIEKPKSSSTSSNLAIAGRYVLTPEVFQELERIVPGAEDELQLTDAINLLNHHQRVFAKKVTGKRYDVGNKMGYMEYSIQYGLSHDETKDELKEYLIQLSKKLKK
ncbi:UTP--glucose-1-phosphate uridylyltransferase GalU [Aerococcaceae bacterium zg-ZUI334]|uniref:UTP--glucose-1-phosphate uridylyltransferase GalU n=1 Tax=Aerococcaceae TaxID=186827 RepID=UPI0013BE1BB2|nr:MULTISPECIES: UTP--glucose-1-phosphate uridylyltransferase GalU [unclassified Facklamia]MBR7926746.1 UTP--glucose-1-phosphate uridylyltransferase GalU [Aerococcaceae bacterium zg-ZUI334]MBS4461697.1 UTP--glucose-1-phosphate uridylyltransferase GalU [Aerococcaceae bacterium zg-B36]QQD65331.1 UTP--glucose-1-phosphate uridylyltransferase GalU [Aerococcaceae bacterium zg-252]NEW63986.1 UTP--glucose-1-phosphate uridylyltransferase GalU [Facklamia sp. 252]NEW67457.1 UTP--glucose-1-phosphate uridy